MAMLAGMPVVAVGLVFVLKGRPPAIRFGGAFLGSVIVLAGFVSFVTSQEQDDSGDGGTKQTAKPEPKGSYCDRLIANICGYCKPDQRVSCRKVHGLMIGVKHGVDGGEAWCKGAVNDRAKWWEMDEGNCLPSSFAPKNPKAAAKPEPAAQPAPTAAPSNETIVLPKLDAAHATSLRTTRMSGQASGMVLSSYRLTTDNGPYKAGAMVVVYSVDGGSNFAYMIATNGKLPINYEIHDNDCDGTFETKQPHKANNKSVNVSMSMCWSDKIKAAAARQAKAPATPPAAPASLATLLDPAIVGHKLDQAIAALKKQGVTPLDIAKKLNTRGMRLYKKRLFAQAGMMFEKAAALAPEYENALFNRACIAGLLNDAKGAVRWLMKLTEIGTVRAQKRLAKVARDKDFDRIRNDPAFKAFVGAP